MLLQGVRQTISYRDSYCVFLKWPLRYLKMSGDAMLLPEETAHARVGGHARNIFNVAVRASCVQEESVFTVEEAYATIMVVDTPALSLSRDSRLVGYRRDSIFHPVGLGTICEQLTPGNG
jgi:hypothetical protein